MNTFGEAIKEQRVSRGLSLLDVEKDTGIRNGSLCRWEKGQVMPGIDFCVRLAKYYDVSLDELVGLTETPQINKHTSLPTNLSKNEIAFVKEHKAILTDNNFINVAKLYSAITPELRALALGYLVGILQNNGVNTKSILGY